MLKLFYFHVSSSSASSMRVISLKARSNPAYECAILTFWGREKWTSVKSHSGSDFPYMIIESGKYFVFWFNHISLVFFFKIWSSTSFFSSKAQYIKLSKESCVVWIGVGIISPPASLPLSLRQSQNYLERTWELVRLAFKTDSIHIVLLGSQAPAA